MQDSGASEVSFADALQNTKNQYKNVRANSKLVSMAKLLFLTKIGFLDNHEENKKIIQMGLKKTSVIRFFRFLPEAVREVEEANTQIRVGRIQFTPHRKLEDLEDILGCDRLSL